MALVLDGKTFAEATMVVALGITMTGDKRFLGFVETDTENEKVLTPFLRSLVERGLDISQGLLVIVDGGQGLRAAVRKAFRHRALGQRCQWHTRENVVSYLAKSEQPVWRQRSTNVPIAELPSPMIRSPSQCPGTARSSTSAGRALIRMSGPTNALPRPRRRARGTRSARPVRRHAVSSRRSAPRPWMYNAW